MEPQGTLPAWQARANRFPLSLDVLRSSDHSRVQGTPPSVSAAGDSGHHDVICRLPGPHPLAKQGTLKAPPCSACPLAPNLSGPASLNRPSCFDAEPSEFDRMHVSCVRFLGESLPARQARKAQRAWNLASPVARQPALSWTALLLKRSGSHAGRRGPRNQNPIVAIRTMV